MWHTGRLLGRAQLRPSKRSSNSLLEQVYLHLNYELVCLFVWVRLSFSHAKLSAKSYHHCGNLIHNNDCESDSNLVEKLDLEPI